MSIVTLYFIHFKNKGNLLQLSSESFSSKSRLPKLYDVLGHFLSFLYKVWMFVYMDLFSSSSEPSSGHFINVLHQNINGDPLKKGKDKFYKATLITLYGTISKESQTKGESNIK